MTSEPHELPATDERLPETNEHLEDIILQKTTGWIPKNVAEPRTQIVKLERPVVIPRVAVHSLLESRLPFLRAYSPALQPYDVQVEEFVAFIDNLAVVQTPPAPFQVLDAAGTAIGFIPWHWAFAAGLAINGAAMAGSKGITHSRTKRYLETVNQKYFAPRGLTVSLCKDNEVAALVGYPWSQPDLVPINPDSTLITVRERRMEALAPYVAPLSTHVPPPSAQHNVLDKISAWQVARRISKQEKKILEKQEEFKKNEGRDEDKKRAESREKKDVKKLEYIVIQNTCEASRQGAAF